MIRPPELYFMQVKILINILVSLKKSGNKNLLNFESKNNPGLLLYSQNESSNGIDYLFLK